MAIERERPYSQFNFLVSWQKGGLTSNLTRWLVDVVGRGEAAGALRCDGPDAAAGHEAALRAPPAAAAAKQTRSHAARPRSRPTAPNSATPVRTMS